MTCSGSAPTELASRNRAWSWASSSMKPIDQFIPINHARQRGRNCCRLPCTRSSGSHINAPIGSPHVTLELAAHQRTTSFATPCRRRRRKDLVHSKRASSDTRVALTGTASWARARAAAIAVAAAMLLVGCTDTPSTPAVPAVPASSPGALTAAGATTTAPAPTAGNASLAGGAAERTTGAAGSSGTDAGPGNTPTAFNAGLETPEAAAKNLWDAWRDDDRDRALLAADPQAVSDLFLDPWGPEVDDQGCLAVVAARRYRCAFVQGNAARLIDVVSVEGRFRVTRVERVGEFASASGPLAPNRPGPVGGPTIVPKARVTAPRSNTQKADRVASSTKKNLGADTTPAEGGAPSPTPTRRKRSPVAVTTTPPTIEGPVAEPTRVQARGAETTAAP